ncbi:TPA: hypothetical protein EYG84_03870, partial [Candidatus Gracilibacteria bacterium]|nr:hypothetical protein [Candidatus Gracilibacteria bacterium]
HLVDVYDEIIPEKTIQKKGEHLDLLYQLIEKLAYFQNAGLPKDRENSFPKGNS